MKNIKEEFKLLKEQVNEERNSSLDIQKFIDAMVALKKEIGDVKNKPAFDFGHLQITNFLLWSLWFEIIKLQEITMKVGEKTYIPITEKIEKEV